MKPDILIPQLKKILPKLLNRELDLGNFDVEFRKRDNDGGSIIITVPIEKFLDWNLKNNGKDFNEYSIRSKMLVSNRFKNKIERIVEKSLKYFTNETYPVWVEYFPRKK